MANRVSFAGGGLRDKSDKLFTFFGNFVYKCHNHKLFPFNNAFSIAEAMVTLLIVSLVLAAMAPIMSKKASNPGGSGIDFPIGAVVAFDLNKCPPHWRDIRELYENSEGAFIRGLGGSAGSKGVVQLDAAPNITGSFVADDSQTGTSGYRTADGKFDPTGAFISGFRTGRVLDIYSTSDNANLFNELRLDAARSSEVYGREETTEVRPKNIALLYCKKIQ